VVAAKLRLDWSPEQIAGHLRETYPDRPSWRVSHETIYQAQYNGGRSGLSRALTVRLRTGPCELGQFPWCCRRDYWSPDQVATSCSMSWSRMGSRAKNR
jgi:hypothetical protein